MSIAGCQSRMIRENSMGVDVIKLAVFGNPIAHSLSPKLHADFARQCNIQINYQKILVPIGEFKKTVDAFRQAGGIGANITAPFKLEAYDYCDQYTDRAKQTHTVNTFIFKNTICIGDNTDGIGFIRDLSKKQLECHQNFHGKNILILGAGGAAQSILAELIAQKPNNIFIKNRTKEKTKKLIDFFAPLFQINVYAGEKIDLLINTTFMNFSHFALSGDLSQTIFYDLNYGERHQSCWHWAVQNNAGAIYDGLGMLIEQGRESFYQWFGV